jgi:hypothetical protein
MSRNVKKINQKGGADLICPSDIAASGSVLGTLITEVNTATNVAAVQAAIDKALNTKSEAAEKEKFLKSQIVSPKESLRALEGKFDPAILDLELTVGILFDALLAKAAAGAGGPTAAVVELAENLDDTGAQLLAETTGEFTAISDEDDQDFFKQGFSKFYLLNYNPALPKIKLVRAAVAAGLAAVAAGDPNASTVDAAGKADLLVMPGGGKRRAKKSSKKTSKKSSKRTSKRTSKKSSKTMKGGKRGSKKSSKKPSKKTSKKSSKKSSKKRGSKMAGGAKRKSGSKKTSKKTSKRTSKKKGSKRSSRK